MEKILMLLAYLINTIITLKLALALFGLQNKEKVYIVGLIGGIADYLVKEIAMPYFKFFNGFHLLSGIIILIISCYYILQLTSGGSLMVSFLSYIFSAISEMIVVIIFLIVLGHEGINLVKTDPLILSIFTVVNIIILTLPLIFINHKRRKLIKISISR